MSYGHGESRHPYYNRTYYSDEEDPALGSRTRAKCSVGTSTGGGYLGTTYQQPSLSPRYRDASSSPQPSSSTHQHYHSPRAGEVDEFNQYHNSPLRLGFQLEKCDWVFKRNSFSLKLGSVRRFLF